MRAPFAALAFAERMYMARLELSARPTLRVYEVEPKDVRLPEYRRGLSSKNRLATKTIPREHRAWFGDANRKLCPPGFAAFGGSEQAAIESLLRVMRDYRDNNGGVQGLGEAIRVVVSRLEGMSHASRAAV
jgi:hypothetical protein